MNLKKYIHSSLLLWMLLSFILPQTIRAGHREDSLRVVISGNAPVKERLKAYSVLGRNYVDMGQLDSARLYLDEGIRIAKKINMIKALPVFYINEGNSYMMQSNYPKALEYYLGCIAIREQLKDSVGLINAFNSIGIVYFRMNELDKALDYFTRSLKLCDRFGKEVNKGDLYSNTAMIYAKRGEVDKAKDYTLKALGIAEKFKEEGKMSSITSNLAELFAEKKMYTEALYYFHLSEKEGADEINEGAGSSLVYGGLGTIYMGLKQYKLAHEYFDKAIHASQKMGVLDELKDEYLSLSQLFAEENNMEEAFRYHKLYARYNDSIFNKQNLDKFNDLKASYEITKKDQQMKQREREKALLQDIKDHRQKVVDYALLAGFLAVIILALIMYRSYRIKKRANAVILIQKGEIELANAELGVVNKEISDSINYAKRIQEAILPSREMIAENLTKAFVFYQPKNVVSGDFYFFSNIGKNEIILAACDCTGHGVPGAFMSMIGAEQLGRIVHERCIYSPALILDELHEGIRKTLHQDRNDSRDGMDIAICKLNLKTRKLEYAGANRPLWIIRKGDTEVTEIKADKQPVGGLETGYHKTFTNKEEVLSEGDRIYLSSDGYADQFGGTKGKKFMVRNFQALLLSIRNQPMKDQEEALRQNFNQWKGNAEQVDDILIIGVEV
jgi:serine phosphatase RsbU (regulator of sigma subunit)